MNEMKMPQKQFSNFNWKFGKQNTPEALANQLSTPTASDASDVIRDSGGTGSVNDGRRNNDGSVNWQNILQAGADVVSQFGNQNQPDETDMQDWNNQINKDDDKKTETTILGMHPVTFSVVAIATIVVASVVIYKVTNKVVAKA